MVNISICIPTYNRKEFILEALDSCFKQTYKDYEIIIVDDGSTDGTKELIESMKASQLKYYYEPHKGQAASRNRLLELATGKYITFLDSDDLLIPDVLERLIIPLKNRDKTISYGAYMGIDEKGNDIPKKQQKLPKGKITKDLFSFIYVHTCGTLFPKGAIEEVGGFDTSFKRCHFYKMLLELSLKYNFIPIKGITYKKRRHSKNDDRTYINTKTELKVLENFYYNLGGKEVIPDKIAHKRIAKEKYRVAKCALRENKMMEARKIFYESLCCKPSIKTFFYWLKSSLKKA